MASKTGGFYDTPIQAGKFVWKWERLLPTNVTLRSFSTANYVSKQTITGTLPSGSIYSKQLKDNPDFSYRADFTVTLRMTPEQIFSQVRQYDWDTQAQIDSYLDTRAAAVAKKVMSYFIMKKENDLAFSTNAVTDEELKSIVAENNEDFNTVTIVSVRVDSAKVPDLKMYNTAKAMYEAYEQEVSKLILKAAESQASVIVDDNRSIEHLEKVGQLLQKYPQLEGIFKTGDAAAIINALKLFH